MVLRKTTLLVGIILSLIIATSIANVYADQIDKKENVQRLLQELLKNYKFNQDSSSLTINNTNNKSIAFVIPSFTTAAYTNSFYMFYTKYQDVAMKYKRMGINESVTTDLDLLSSTVSEKSKSLTSHKATGLLYLAQHISGLSPNTNIDMLTDEEVHNGFIFDSNKQNLYNAIVLGHQEYVSQQEYDNFKTFVENGGTLILLDANMFYAEVAYDPTTNKITLVKGHFWGFDGQKAWPDVKERWANENTEWVGSNFACSTCIVTLLNNPFQYAHYEEQTITNPNAKILIDYQAKTDYNYTMGSYELKNSLGKVISFGIFGDNVVTNKNFLQFFDNILVANYLIANPTQPPLQEQQQQISQADTLSEVPSTSETIMGQRNIN